MVPFSFVIYLHQLTHLHGCWQSTLRLTSHAKVQTDTFTTKAQVVMLESDGGRKSDGDDCPTATVSTQHRQLGEQTNLAARLVTNLPCTAPISIGA